MAPPTSDDLVAIAAVLERARAIATDYGRLTGKPLGVTGEIGEFEAARLLGLRLAGAREPGFDAVDAAGTRYQIKTRCLTTDGLRKSQQIGGIKLAHPWDAVLVVILDRDLHPVGIWRAERAAVSAALLAPGSKARNERGALAFSKFRSIGRQVWPVPAGPGPAAAPVAPGRRWHWWPFRSRARRRP